MKYLGILSNFLGMEVTYSKDNICLSQQRYILNTLTKTRFFDCKPTLTPIDPNSKLALNEGDPKTDQGEYQRLVGKLIYLPLQRLTFPIQSMY